MRGIGQIGDVGDAKRLRSDVAAQIRKAKGLTGTSPIFLLLDGNTYTAYPADGKSLDDEVDGVKVSEWIDYIERLYSAKRKADRRIGKLGGVVGSSVLFFLHLIVRTRLTLHFSFSEPPSLSPPTRT
jgi:sorting nexin-25